MVQIALDFPSSSVIVTIGADIVASSVTCSDEEVGTLSEVEEALAEAAAFVEEAFLEAQGSLEDATGVTASVEELSSIFAATESTPYWELTTKPPKPIECRENGKPCKPTKPPVECKHHCECGEYEYTGDFTKPTGDGEYTTDFFSATWPSDWSWPATKPSGLPWPSDSPWPSSKPTDWTWPPKPTDGGDHTWPTAWTWPSSDWTWPASKPSGFPWPSDSPWPSSKPTDWTWPSKPTGFTKPTGDGEYTWPSDWTWPASKPTDWTWPSDSPWPSSKPTDWTWPSKPTGFTKPPNCKPCKPCNTTGPTNPPNPGTQEPGMCQCGMESESRIVGGVEVNPVSLNTLFLV